VNRNGYHVALVGLLVLCLVGVTTSAASGTPQDVRSEVGLYPMVSPLFFDSGCVKIPLSLLAVDYGEGSARLSSVVASIGDKKTIVTGNFRALPASEFEVLPMQDRSSIEAALSILQRPGLKSESEQQTLNSILLSLRDAREMFDPVTLRIPCPAGAKPGEQYQITVSAVLETGTSVATVVTAVAQEYTAPPEWIVGDVHVHSEWSDGNDSLAEIRDDVTSLGHDYVSVTDHIGMLGDVGYRLYYTGCQDWSIESGNGKFTFVPGIEVAAVDDVGGSGGHCLGLGMMRDTLPGIPDNYYSCADVVCSIQNSTYAFDYMTPGNPYDPMSALANTSPSAVELNDGRVLYVYCRGSTIYRSYAPSVSAFVGGADSVSGETAIITGLSFPRATVFRDPGGDLYMVYSYAMIDSVKVGGVKIMKCAVGDGSSLQPYGTVAADVPWANWGATNTYWMELGTPTFIWQESPPHWRWVLGHPAVANVSGFWSCKVGISTSDDDGQTWTRRLFTGSGTLNYTVQTSRNIGVLENDLWYCASRPMDHLTYWYKSSDGGITWQTAFTQGFPPYSGTYMVPYLFSDRDVLYVLLAAWQGPNHKLLRAETSPTSFSDFVDTGVIYTLGGSTYGQFNTIVCRSETGASHAMVLNGAAVGGNDRVIGVESTPATVATVAHPNNLFYPWDDDGCGFDAVQLVGMYGPDGYSFWRHNMMDGYQNTCTCWAMGGSDNHQNGLGQYGAATWVRVPAWAGLSDWETQASRIGDALLRGETAASTFGSLAFFMIGNDYPGATLDYPAEYYIPYSVHAYPIDNGYNVRISWSFYKNGSQESSASVGPISSQLPYSWTDLMVLAPADGNKEAYYLRVVFEYFDGDTQVLNDWVECGPIYVRGI